MKSRIGSMLFFLGILIAGNIVAFKIVHLPNQFQLVALMTLLFFYPVLRYPIIGVYIMFIVLPFIPFLRRLYYLAYSRPTADPLIIIGDIVMTIMIAGLFFTFREQIQMGTFRKKVAFLVLLYFLYMLLRVFVYNELPLNMALLKFRFYGPQVLLFFVGMLYAFEEKHLKRLWGITLAIAAVSVLYGLKQFFFGYIEAERIWFSSIDFTSLFIKGTARPFSFFQAPAAFADYMQVAVIGIIAFSGWNKGAGKLAWALMPLLSIGVLITSVRSNWVGMALSMVIWLFVVRAKGMRMRLLVLGAFGLVFLVSDIFQTMINAGLGIGSLVATISGTSGVHESLTSLITERANAVTNPFQEYSMISRVALWKYIIEMSVDPQLAIFGRGVGVLNADSLYITYLAEFGYTGMLLIIWIFLTFIRHGFELLDKSPSAQVTAVARAIITMDIVFAIINVTGSHIHAFPGDTYFWFWNGVLMGLWSAHWSSKKTEEAHEIAADA
jgi:hypothetical protein